LLLLSDKPAMKRSTVIVTDLQTDAQLGLGLAVSSVDGVGIIVKSLVHNGPAKRDGRLRIGDHIDSIAGHSLEGATQADADWLIGQLQGCVRIVASRPLQSWKSDSELCMDSLSDSSRVYVLNAEMNSDRRERSVDRSVQSVINSEMDLGTITSAEINDQSTHNMTLTGSQQMTSRHQTNHMTNVVERDMDVLEIHSQHIGNGRRLQAVDHHTVSAEILPFSIPEVILLCHITSIIYLCVFVCIFTYNSGTAAVIVSFSG